MTTSFTPPEDIDVWDAENVFYLRSPTSRIGKLLAHYRLFQMVSDLPGAIVECGVYKGVSLMRFATFRHFLENDDSREIIGLDAFGAFPRDGVKSSDDLAFIDRFEDAGGAGISKEELERLIEEKGLSNVELCKGDVLQTIPDLLERKPHLRIALLHLDMDVYEPTRFAIDQFLPHMVPGGLIVFDDYNAVDGATRAADELCQEHGFELSKLRFYNVPAYVKVSR